MTPFTSNRAHSVAAHGERRLIAGIRRWLGRASPDSPFGIGDDCAVIPPTRHHQLVTTDPVIWGQHFDATVSARAVGAKLLKRNLSDIAAMGGRPVAAVVSLALAPQTSVRWLEQFYRGLAACALKHDVKIVGGDITQGPAGFFGAFLTLHGESAGLPRDHAQRRPSRQCDLRHRARSAAACWGITYSFIPRLAEGAWLAGRPEVCAMMDVSDGLAEGYQLPDPRWTRARPRRQGYPRERRGAASRPPPPGKPRWPTPWATVRIYELLIVVRTGAAKFERDWRKRFPKLKLSRLGRFVPENQLPADALRLADYHGYEHLR